MGLQGAVGVLGHGELLLDGPLDAHQADPEAVLQQLAHRPHPAVAQVVDVVLAHRRDLIRPLGTGGVVLLQAQQVVDGGDEVLDAEGAGLQVGGEPQLGVHLVPADLGQVVLLGVEEHGVEQLLGALQGGGLARADLLEQLLGGLFTVLGVVLGQGLAEHLAGGVVVREADGELLDVVGQEHLHVGLHEGVVGLQQHLARVHVDHVLEQHGAVQEVALHRHPADPGLLQVLHQPAADDLGLGHQDVLALGVLDVVQGLLAHEQVAGGHEHVRALEHEPLCRIEVAQQGLVVRQALIEQAQGAQEGGAQELALAVDAGVEQALGVQLELDPAAPVGDHLGAVQGLVAADGEEHPGAAVQLGDDDPLGAVDDEGAAVGHGRQVAEVDLGLLGLLVATVALLVLVELVQAHADLQGRGHGGAALHALLHGHLLVQAHRLVADVADLRLVLVAGAALGAVHRRVLGVVGDDVVATALAGGPEVFESLDLPALAGPVTDRVVHELHFQARVAAVRVLAVVHGEHGFEHGLEAPGIPLRVEQVHLEELVVAALLDVDQVGNGHQGADLGELDPLAVDVLLNTHGSLRRTPAEALGRPMGKLWRGLAGITTSAVDAPTASHLPSLAEADPTDRSVLAHGKECNRGPS